VRIVPPTDKGLADAVAALRRGAIVAYPTETVYGLAVDPFSSVALSRLFAAKGRPETHPVLLIVADRSQLGRVVREVSAAACVCMDEFWPGPLSLLLPKAENLSSLLTGANDRVCVRHTAHPVASALCTLFGGALTSTSANHYGEPAACSAAALAVPGVAVAIDGGTLPPSAPSTVYNPDTGEILREGAIPREALERIRNRSDGPVR